MERKESGIDMDYDLCYNTTAAGGELCGMKSTPCSRRRQQTLKNSVATNRTNFKQLLSRQSIYDEEQKKKEQGFAPIPEKTAAAFKSQSNAIKMTTPISVPLEVLGVESCLDNPTPYHMAAKLNSQVRNFLQPRIENTAEGPFLANDAVFNNIASNTLHDPSEGMVEVQVEAGDVPEDGMIVASGVDINENDLLEDLLNLTERQSLRQLVVVDGRAAEDLVNKLQTSVSCPILPENETADQKERRKKDDHNKIERRRRNNIKQQYDRLTYLVSHMSPTLKKNKGTILNKACEYIHKLEGELKELNKKVIANKRIEDKNRLYLLKIQELELKLQEAGLSVENPMWQKASTTELESMMEISTNATNNNVEEGQPVEKEAVPFLETRPANMSTCPALLETEDENCVINGDPMLSAHLLVDDGIFIDFTESLWK